MQSGPRTYFKAIFQDGYLSMVITDNLLIMTIFCVFRLLLDIYVSNINLYSLTFVLNGHVGMKPLVQTVIIYI